MVRYAWWTWTNPVILTGPSSLGHRLTVALRTGAKSIPELADLTAANPDTIGRMLRRMADKGDVRQVTPAYGHQFAKWGLSAPEFGGVQPSFPTKEPEPAPEDPQDAQEDPPEDIPLDERCGMCETARADRYTPNGVWVCEECGAKVLAEQEEEAPRADTA